MFASQHGGFRFAKSAAVGIALSLGFSDIAAAQIEEIIVTARKRQEVLQEIPLSISAFTQTQLEERGIEDITDLANFTPGLTYTSAISRSGGQIFVRGIAQTAGVGDTRRDVASIFIDGIYYAGATSAIGFEDLERVEVVKGPQSAFFGRATFAGAINFITSTPGDEFKFRGRLKAAQHNDYDVSASVEGPLVPGVLAGRIAVSYEDFGGEYTNTLTGKKLGQQRNESISGSLAFTPAENFSAKLRASYLENADSQPASQLLARVPTHNCPNFGGSNNGGPRTLFCGKLNAPTSFALNDTVFPLTTSILGVSEMGLDRDFGTIGLNADWDVSNGYTISLLVGHQAENMHEMRDFELTASDVYQSLIVRSQRAFSQEVRIASPTEEKFRWLIGGYNFEQNYMVGSAFINGANNPFLTPARPAGIANPVGYQFTDIKNRAVFGSVEYDVTPQLTAAVELRWARDRVGTPLAAGGEFAFTTKAWLPRFIVDWKPTDSATLYVNVAKGNQPTQGNASLITLNPQQRAVAEAAGLNLIAPEAKLTAYETGAKTTWLDGRIMLNGALYYMEWKGKQGVRSFFIDLNQDGVIDQRNVIQGGEVFNSQAAAIGDLNLWGLELETAFALTDALTTGVNLSYTKSKNIAVQDPFWIRHATTQFVPKANREAGVPQWSSTAYGEYRAPLTSDYDYFVRSDFVYVGNRYESILNVTKSGASLDVNVKVGIESDSLKLTLFADNLFNDKTVESLRAQGDSATDPVRFAPFSVEAYAPRGRQIGITATVDF